ncbi:MAG TPA: phage tail protein [Spirillospora sp.]|nr:phage tail protein [Spirillospora sp.]
MATERARPYSAFNYLVALGTGEDTSSPRAGFQEVTGLGVEITVQEYRPGNYALNSPMKITGMHKITDVTLKRGVIAALDLWEWLNAVRTGSQNALRTVTIQLQNEERTEVVMTWKLTNARPMKYTGPSFNGKGTDVGVEELVLAAEDISIE